MGHNSAVDSPADMLAGQHPWSKAAGEELKTRREAAGLSQPSLAKLVGVHPNTIGNLERGKGRPAEGNLEAIAGVLKVPVAALLPPETKEATAFKEGVAHAYRELQATLVDLQHRLGLGEGTPGGRKPAGLGAVREGRKARPARPRRKPPEDEQDTG